MLHDTLWPDYYIKRQAEESMGEKGRRVGEGRNSNGCGWICNRRKKDGLHDKMAKIGQREPISNSVERLRQAQKIGLI